MLLTCTRTFGPPGSRVIPDVHHFFADDHVGVAFGSSLQQQRRSAARPTSALTASSM